MADIKIQNVLRRKAIKLTLLHVAAITMATTNFPLRAGEGTDSGKCMAVIDLISTLRAMDKDVCDIAATNLEASLNSGSALSLHLRNAELNLSNTLELAGALRNLVSTSKNPLLSFSVSHNPKLGDPGVVALVQSLPQTLQEIGFVECNIHDTGGEAILQWARQAPNLKMICIERNSLTQHTKSLFRAFSISKPETTVIF